jgi:hypothetical protein
MELARGYLGGRHVKSNCGRGVARIAANPGAQQAFAQYVRSATFQQHAGQVAKKLAEEIGQKVVEDVYGGKTPKQSLLSLFRGY